MTLYLDLDGCFADFDKQLLDCSGIDNTGFRNGEVYSEAEAIRRKTEAHRCMSIPGFWAQIPLCTDAYRLWDFCQQFRPVILTALPNLGDWDETVLYEKQLWIDKYFGFRTPVIYCLRHQKKDVVKSGLQDVLLDDTIQNVTEWVSEGGFGILHTDIENSIKKLSYIYREVI